jgi:hypothetical protein
MVWLSVTEIGVSLSDDLFSRLDARYERRIFVAVLIPSLSTCVSRMTGGEKRFAARLETKLEDDYLLWYDVSIGPANTHPDFVVLHPQRGILILEVNDWKPETIRSANKQTFELLINAGIKHVINPLEQARQYAHAVSNALQRDTQLTINSGRKRCGRKGLID